MNLLIKRVSTTIFIAVVIFLLFGRDLNPFSKSTFTFHDQTQIARLLEFKTAIENGQVPPRIAPHFSFNLGYPVFAFYAPSGYILTYLLFLTGLSVASVLQLSFLLCLIFACLGTYAFLKYFFKSIPSFLGGLTYITTLYVPLSIFVRGNLAEAWLIALLPWGMYSLLPASGKYSILGSIARVVILVLLFTSHNALSLVAIVYLFAYLVIQRGRKEQWLIFFAGILGSLYFFLPFFVENSLTWATTVAVKTNLYDHFLCPVQLWTGQWGYGGSAVGCLDDGMSFKLGKIQLSLFLLGLLSLLYKKILNKKLDHKSYTVMIYVVIVTTIIIFATTNLSSSFWKMLPSLALLQYPWRLLAFTPIGFAFSGAYFVSNLSNKLRIYGSIVMLVALIVVQNKYFVGQKILKSQYMHDFGSLEYIQTKAAYLVPEYLPKSVNYDKWRSFESAMGDSRLPVFSEPVVVSSGKYELLQNSAFRKIVSVNPQEKLTVNVHYMPYWKIYVDKKEILPNKQNIDELGRPFFPITKPSIVQVYYQQTQAQIWGLICLLVAVILGGLVPKFTNDKAKLK